MQNINITLPDGRVQEYRAGITVSEIVDPQLAGKVIVAGVNGSLVDLSCPLVKDATIKFYTFDTEEGRQVYHHSTAHIMAHAVQRLFPGARLAIGPAIENGFYYDFDTGESFTPEKLEQIEKEMKAVIKENLPLERFELSRPEAVAMLEKAGQSYKIELIEDLPPGTPLSFYREGDFVDLCAGPHVPSTGFIKSFKLLSVAGAYWRGSEKNKMLQRIYGISFPSDSLLEKHLFRLSEARRRDHRKLGAELDLFSIQDEGPGFPFFHPRGMIIRNELEQYWREEHRKRGYQEIRTPVILSRALWEQSGHWDHYRENMYFTTIDQIEYAVKPMNCPGAMLVYKQKQHSYRELPLRLAEMGLVHRHELSGVLHGLMRVRCFTQDDAHIFMLPSQIKEEIAKVIDLVDDFYRVFGFSYHIELSTRPEKAMGSEEIWEEATAALREALEDCGRTYKVNEGDGAFYGPKIDFHLKDSLDRTWQCGTIQLDFLMPEKFDLAYIGEDGLRHRPVMIHRVIFGSIERFIGILAEHFAGAFPVWLAPVQVRLLPITDRSIPYARNIIDMLSEQGIRVEIDARNEKVGYKIRDAQLQKIPYMLVVGDKEAANGTVAVRHRTEGDQGAIRPDELREKIKTEINLKVIK